MLELIVRRLPVAAYGSLPFPIRPRPIAMPMLPARGYVSEHTQFIRKLLADKPAIEGVQRQGRALWWDKKPDELAAEREMEEGKVAQRAYVYYSID